MSSGWRLDADPDGDNGARHAGELVLPHGRQDVLVLHGPGQAPGDVQGGGGLGVDADRAAHVDGDVVPGGDVGLDLVGGVPAGRDVGVDVVEDDQAGAGDRLGDLGVVAHEVGHEGAALLVEVEGHHGRLGAEVVDGDEVAHAGSGQQPARVVLGQGGVG